MIRKPQLDLLTLQGDLTVERRLCDYIIENINNEEKMLEAVLTLEQYFAQKSSFCALSLRSTELLSHVLNHVLRKCLSLDVKTACIRIYSQIISSSCNHVLKNRLITAAEPELIYLFLSTEELQSTIWDCFAFHLMSTRKLAPIIRLLMSCVFANGWNRQKRIMCMENLQNILKENKDATMTHEDLSIILMFVLEKLLDGQSREDEEITIHIMKIFIEIIPSEELESSAALLPKHLQSVFATIKNEDDLGVFAEGKHRYQDLDHLLTQQESTPINEENNFANTIEQLHLRYCTEFARTLQHYSESVNISESPTLRELESEFPSILDVLSSLFKRSRSQVTRKLLDTMQIILDHLSSGIIQSHFPEISRTLTVPLSDMNKDIRKKLSRILVSICQQVLPELVVEQLMRFIQETHVPEIHTGLMKAVMFVLLLFQCEQVNLLALCQEISPLLCTDNFELMQVTFGFFTVLFDRVGWESGSTGEELTKTLLHLVAQQLSFRVDSTKICTLLSQLKSCLTSRTRPYVDSDGLLQYKGSFHLCKEARRSLHARSPAEMAGRVEVITSSKMRLRGAIDHIKNEKTSGDHTSPDEPLIAKQIGPPHYVTENEVAECFQMNFNHLPISTVALQPRKPCGFQTQTRKRFTSPTKITRPKESSYALINQEKRMKNKHTKPTMIRGRFKPVRARRPDSVQKNTEREQMITQSEPNFSKEQSNTLLSSSYPSSRPVPVFRCPQKVRFASEKEPKQPTEYHGNSVDNETSLMGSKIPALISPLLKPLPSASSLDTMPTSLSRHKSNILKSANTRRRCDDKSPNPPQNYRNKLSKSGVSLIRKRKNDARCANHSPRRMQITSQSPKLFNRNFILRLPDLKGDARSMDDLLNRLISSIEVGDWDEQLKGLETFKCLIVANNYEIMNKLLTNDYLLQRLIRGVVRAVTNLRSQLSRCAVSSINLFGKYLRSTRQGHLLDVQADRILSALIRRVGEDRSIKFLFNESFDALCSITRALSPTVVVNLLCLQVSEQKAKSAKTRIVVGNILRQRLEIITHSVEDMEEFLRQFSAEGMERLIKVAAILTEDRLSETRAHGREIFRLVSSIKDIREFCRQKLPDRVWRVIQPIFQESSKP